MNFKKLKATFNGFFFSYPWACLTMPIQITSIWKKIVKNSQKWGYSHVCVWKSILGNLSTKTLCTKFPKHETFHLYVSGDHFSWSFSMKSICYKLDKHQAFLMYVSWNIYLNFLYLNILYLKLHKHEAFHLYVLESAFLGSFSLKILCYKLKKSEAFHQCVSGEGF